MNISTAVILAGGRGSRISEETSAKPKPMIMIGERPILWHIMKIYSQHGIKNFIICLGYLGYVIKEYFLNYVIHNADVTINLLDGSLEVRSKVTDDWKITLVDTGLDTMTGGRLARVRDYLSPDGHFCFTYGDGVGDIDITSLIKTHFNSGLEATVTLSRPPGRFGAVTVEGGVVSSFKEKPAESSYVNAGFFVLSPAVMSYIAGDNTIWEREPLEVLAAERKLGAYFHRGFWHPMDTLRDSIYLNELWNCGSSPWRTW